MKPLDLGEVVHDLITDLDWATWGGSHIRSPALLAQTVKLIVDIHTNTGIVEYPGPVKFMQRKALLRLGINENEYAELLRRLDASDD